MSPANINQIVICIIGLQSAKPFSTNSCLMHGMYMFLSSGSMIEDKRIFQIKNYLRSTVCGHPKVQFIWYFLVILRRSRSNPIDINRLLEIQLKRFSAMWWWPWRNNFLLILRCGLVCNIILCVRTYILDGLSHHTARLPDICQYPFFGHQMSNDIENITDIKCPWFYR